MRARVGAATAALALALLTGCQGSGDSPAAHPVTGASSTTTASSPAPMLTPTAPASSSLGAGQRVWAAFSERGLSHAEWWGQLKGLLSRAAQAAYFYDDPRNLPAMQLTGKLHVAARPPTQPRYTTEVLVPTSKGVFGLDLERHTLRSRWLLYAIKFPHTVQ